MGWASSLALLLLSAGVLSVTVGSQTTLMLEVEAGDDVTLWCRHSVTEPAHIYWFKHTNTSVPERLTCLQYKLFSPPSPCVFITHSNRTVMNLNSKNASLRITEVNYTDSGLYYCCTQRGDHITFTNSTFLLVQDRDETLFQNSSRASCSSELLFILTVVFSAVVVVLFSALLLTLKNRKPCRDDAGSTLREEKEERDGEMMNYAALQFTKKVKRSAGHSEDPHVVYSSRIHFIALHCIPARSLPPPPNENSNTAHDDEKQNSHNYTNSNITRTSTSTLNTRMLHLLRPPLATTMTKG
ncbi:hypothetical protein NFI96_008124 [Prochilodus magdalenae]|nr:hypothetical protein NFI96_008124 [Prochilodus magdalenae]